MDGLEIADIQKRIADLEAEAAKLREMQKNLEQVQEEMGEDKEDIDDRSIFVGNVDYGTTPEELQAHFRGCGTINRVTILLDQATGRPRGYAYVEFTEPIMVVKALLLNGSIFRLRTLKVVPKRTNLPGMSSGNPRGGGHGRGGRGGYPSSNRGGYRSPGPYQGGYREEL